MTPINAFQFIALSLVVKHSYEGQESAANLTSFKNIGEEKVTYLHGVWTQPCLIMFWS